MEAPAEGMSQRVAGAEARIVKGQRRHGGRQMDVSAHGRLARERARQQPQQRPAGAVGQRVRHGAGLACGRCLHTVRNGVHAGFRDEARGQSLEQGGVQNGQLRPQGRVHEGVLDAVQRQDGERCDLRATAGRRRHGHEADGQAAERGDALGAVDGGAAAEGQNGVRPQGLQAGDALCHQRKRGIGRDVGELFDLRAGKGRGIAGGRAVFGKIGVRDEQHALGVQPGEGRGGVRAEAQPRAADKALHDIASFRR